MLKSITLNHVVLYLVTAIKNIENMRLGDDSINWVESIKYLGVLIVPCLFLRKIESDIWNIICTIKI